MAVRRRCRTLMTETEPTKNLEAKTVLVVEDESLLREMESSILQGCGYQVLEAESGRKALELAWTGPGGKA